MLMSVGDPVINSLTLLALHLRLVSQHLYQPGSHHASVFFMMVKFVIFAEAFATAHGMATASPQFGNRLEFLATKLDSCVIWLMLLLLHALMHSCCAFDNVETFSHLIIIV